MNTDSEHVLPPDLMLVEPFTYEDVSLLDRMQATVTDLDGAALEIHGAMTWFRLRSDLGRAVLAINRHGDDQNNAPIGLFVQDWTYEEMAKLQSLAEGIPWAELLEPEGGDISGAQITIRYSSRSTVIDRGFNSYNWDFMNSIGSLLDWIDAKHAALLNKSPLAGLRLSVEARPVPHKPGEYTLHVAFFNPGTHPVLFHDPRRPPRPDAVDPQPRLILRVTPDTDLPTPPFVRMTLTPPEPDSPKMITLPGGGRFEVIAPWTPSAPGAYGVIAEWIDYEPPLEGVEYAPIMPLPSSFDEPFVELKAPYPLMGGAFTGRMIEIPGPGASAQ